jgi:hypothetical protein
LTAPWACASADITLKIDVPVAGSLERIENGACNADIVASGSWKRTL